MSSVLGSPSLAESLAEALRQQIIRGEVAPGLRVTEAWVANRVAEGLLRRGLRHSSIVPQLSTEDIYDICFSREPVETLAVRTLAETRSVPGDARQALTTMRVAAEHSRHSDHTEADVAFHRALVAAAGSPRLQRMHGTVMGEAQLCIAQVRRTASTDLVELTVRHAAIIDAIREGDGSAAEEAMRADLRGCRDMLLADAAQRAGVAV